MRGNHNSLRLPNPASSSNMDVSLETISIASGNKMVGELGYPGVYFLSISVNRPLSSLPHKPA